MRRLMFCATTAMFCLAVTSPAQEWSTPVRISEPGGGYYPQIIAQGDTLHVVYENNYTYDKIRYVRSTDAGLSWGEHAVLSERRGSTAFPHVVQWGRRLMALWRMYFSNGITRLNIGYTVSEDNGLTWTAASYALEYNRDYIHTFGASSADSVVNIIFYDDWGPDNAFYSLCSTNFGQDWSQATRMFGVLQSERRDCASFDSTVHLSWEGRFDISERVEIYYSRSTDQGITWGPNVALSEPDQFHSQLQAICVDGMGRPRVSWMDYKYAPPGWTGDIFMRASPDSGANWGPEQQITFNHLAERSDIAQSGDTVAIVWEDTRQENGRGSIYCTISLDGGETWNEPDRLDADTCGSINPSIAVSNNRIYAIWQEGRFSQDSNGVFFSCWSEVPDAIGGSQDAKLPGEIKLSAYPNPFNTATILALRNLKGGEAEIIIYDIQGRRIRTFQFCGAGGEAQISWDATDAQGKKVSSGVYFARARAPHKGETIKLMYLK